MRLDLFVKLKYELNYTILFLCIRYSMRDLLSDLLYLTRKLALCVKNGQLCQHFLWHQLVLASCEFYRVAQKIKPLPNYQKIVLNRIKACQ